jgi:hypothetical protein
MGILYLFQTATPQSEQNEADKKKNYKTAQC